ATAATEITEQENQTRCPPCALWLTYFIYSYTGFSTVNCFVEKHMPQPLDPAVQALLERTPRVPFVLPDPPPPAAELALAIRARDRAAAPARVDDFGGTITE